MGDGLKLVALPDGQMLVVGEDTSGIRLDSYRPLEFRVGIATRNGPPQKPTAAFALRRFATVEELAKALRSDLAELAGSRPDSSPRSA